MEDVLSASENDSAVVGKGFKGAVDYLQLTNAPADEPDVTYSGSEEPDDEPIKVFDLNDLVAMQNWLLARPNSDLADWKAGDLCDDGKLSLYDMIAMRQLFLGE